MSVVIRKFWVFALAVVAGLVLFAGEAFAQEIKNQDTETLVFPESQEFSLKLPEGWSVEEVSNTVAAGSIEISNFYVFDKEGKMVFRLNYPLWEVGHEFATSKNERTVTTKTEMELNVVDRIMKEDSSTGFAYYSWKGDDFRQDSFEVFVPFQEELYARTATEDQAGTGVETRYDSYQDYQEHRAYIDEIITGSIGDDRDEIDDKDTSGDGKTTFRDWLNQIFEFLKQVF